MGLDGRERSIIDANDWINVAIADFHKADEVGRNEPDASVAVRAAEQLRRRASTAASIATAIASLAVIR